MNEQDFLLFLTDVLIADEPLRMDENIPEDLFDSTGKLLFVTAVEKQLGQQLTVESILQCITPRDLYTLLGN